jgi:hypothetical protein
MRNCICIMALDARFVRGRRAPGDQIRDGCEGLQSVMRGGVERRQCRLPGGHRTCFTSDGIARRRPPE